MKNAANEGNGSYLENGLGVGGRSDSFLLVWQEIQSGKQIGNWISLFVKKKKKKYKTTEMGGVGGGVIGEIFVKNFKQEGEIRKKISNFFSR